SSGSSLLTGIMVGVATLYGHRSFLGGLSLMWMGPRRGRPHRIAKEDLVAAYPASHRFSVGIEEEFGRIEAVAVMRRIRPIDAIAIALPRLELGHIPVPHRIGAGGERQTQPLIRTLWGVKEAEVDARSMGGEQGEIHPRAIPGGA